MATIGNHQQTAFIDPQNTQSPIDANQVKANDNALRVVYNAHDNDPTIHIQSSPLASRGAFGTVGQTWLVTDQMKLYYDTGLGWDSLRMDAGNLDTGTLPSGRLSGAYSGITGVGTLTSLNVSGAATIGTGLTVSAGGATITGNSTITGTLGGITTLTATNLAGTLSTAAQPNVTSLGTLTSLAVSGTLQVSGQIGIGTGSPGFLLDMNSTTNTILSQWQGAGTNFTLRLKTGDGSVQYGSIYKLYADYLNGSNINGYIEFLRGASGTDGSLAFGTQNTERMRISASGSVGIGTNNPGALLDVANTARFFGPAASSGNIIIQGDNASATAFWISGKSDSSFHIGGAGGTEPTTGRIVLNTGGNILFNSSGGTERARITSGGYFKASNSGTYLDAAGIYHELVQDGAAVTALTINRNNSSPFGHEVRFNNASPDNNTNWFLKCVDSTTDRMFVYSDGDLANHDGVYGTISDAKLKQDITDAPSQWGDLKAIRFRKYRMKSDVEAKGDGAPYLLGVVAQELQQTSPGLVDSHPDTEQVEVEQPDGSVTIETRPTGTETLSVKSSILLMKAAVALQEAMARIEALEARVAVLEAQ